MSDKVAFYSGITANTTAFSDAPLTIEGTVPEWLRGTLYRNGPALWEVGSTKLAHWFDGFAKLHAFTFADDGSVRFTCRMLEGETYRRSFQRGSLWRRAFATEWPRPWWRRLKDLFLPRFGDNALVNVQPVAGNIVAMTESPRQVRVDAQTLAALGDFKLHDRLFAHNTTAHPVVDPHTGDQINLLTKYGKSTSHTFARLPRGSQTRQVIGTLIANSPSYHHSFGLSRRFIVFTEWPFMVKPLEIILGKNTILGSYRWQPEHGLRIRLLERETGKVFGPFATDAAFGFHHVNAFDEDESLTFDIPIVTGPHVFDELRMEQFSRQGIINYPILRRYKIDIRSGNVTHHNIGEGPFDFPVIDERQRTQPLRYVYGCAADLSQHTGMLDSIVRRDLFTGTDVRWQQPGCYPGEPLFVARPGGDHDEGVLLSVVLDAAKAASFLVILDAQTLTQVARLPTPTVVPLGFHGSFVPAV